ncbi:hypothetical protein HDV03_003129 [Kappamyces sp. JEL0829]|nr:hypothetical protein HDV03_003114 [Kappamyces sp. JEL0829]KAJ3304143.1 hypothetical protein HDV03_003129 [Kappamyces sp. JEL0829]
MKTLVVGGGGIGGLVARSNHDWIGKNGLVLTCSFAPRTVWKPDRLYASVHQVVEEMALDWTHIVVCTKTTAEVTDLLEPYLARLRALKTQAADRACSLSWPLVHLVQNGVGIETALKTLYPDLGVVTCSALVRTYQTDVGIITHSGPKTFTMGFYGSHTPLQEQTLKEYIAMGVEAGIDMVLSPHIQWVRWHKLAWNASFNPLTVLMDAQGPLELLDQPHMNALVHELMGEIFGVAELLHGPKPPTLSHYTELIPW